MNKTPKKEIMRNPNYSKIYVTNVEGGLTSHDFRFELLNEKIEQNKKWIYVSDGLLILTPIGAKRLMKKLEASINVYEKEHGTIPEDPEIEKIIRINKE